MIHFHIKSDSNTQFDSIYLTTSKHKHNFPKRSQERINLGSAIIFSTKSKRKLYKLPSVNPQRTIPCFSFASARDEAKRDCSLNRRKKIDFFATPAIAKHYEAIHKSGRSQSAPAFFRLLVVTYKNLLQAVGQLCTVPLHQSFPTAVGSVDIVY